MSIKPLRTLLALLSLCLAAPVASAAVPMQIPLQGALRDNAGAPVSSGTFEMTFTLYRDAEGTDSAWTTTRIVTVQGGLFRAMLGEETPVDPQLFGAEGGLWLGVTVEQEPELPLRPLASTPYALAAGEAAGLSCSGCVGPEALSAEASSALTDAAVSASMAAVEAAGYDAAQGTSYDGATSSLEATTVQSAIDELKGLLDEATSGGGASGNVNEGAGTVRAYTNQWGLPSYGTATDYVHVIHPSPPKVQLYLYGGENTGFASSNNLIVSNTYTPNSYAGGANGGAGQDTLSVGNNAGAFNIGDHVLIHQSVGNDPGHWELNAVKSVQGNSLGLAKPLVHTYESASGDDQRRAQVVIAASYNQLEVINGGVIQPGQRMGGNNDDSASGGIVYVRAQAITVKTGGKIQANGGGSSGGLGGFWGQDSHNSGNAGCGKGLSECSITDASWGHSNNCSGGGGGYYTGSNNSSTRGGGGGGNKTAGQDGKGGTSNIGLGGAAKGFEVEFPLEFGGGGGDAVGDGGQGGGIVVLGAKTLIIESGGTVSANGAVGGVYNPNSYGGGGGGAGGTVALFAETLDNQGTVEVNGGAGGDGWSDKDGGDGGEGWVLEMDPIPGVVSASYATGVEIWVDGQEITPAVGDPNAKGTPHWSDTEQAWGATGTDPWSTGPLDLTNVANWTLGEHTIQFKETGGAGGDLKAYLYLIQTFSGSSPPVNDTCTSPVAIDLAEGPVVLSGTTEDVMGKIQATDAHATECGGEGGADVTYRIDLAERSLINVATTSPFPMRLYLRSESCAEGEVIYCATADFSTTPLEPGTYFLVVDADTAEAKGDFTLAVSLTPALLPVNDTCDTSMELIVSNQGVATHTSSTLYALDQYEAFCTGAGGPDVVYHFSAATGQTININVTSDEFEPVMHLYKDSCADGFLVACDSSGSLQNGPQAGGDYWLVIDSAAEAEWGAFDLTVTLQ